MFNKLDRNTLQDKARKWQAQLEGVSKISLYESFTGDLSDGPKRCRYCLVFELAIQTELEEKNEPVPENVSREIFSLCGNIRILIETKAFLADIKDVYIKEPDSDYEKDWDYSLLFASEELPNSIRPEPCWQLYPVEESLPITIQVPPGTQWGKITIRILNEQRIEITTPNGMAPWTAEQIGFKKKITLWELFRDFAKEHGNLKPEWDYKYFTKANVSNLRKHLKNLIPNVVGLPIRKYDREEGYICNFLISISTSEPFNAGNTDDYDRKADIIAAFAEDTSRR